MTHQKNIFVFCLTILALPLSNSLNAARPQWLGRAVPMAYNKQTQEWSILFGHNARNQRWTDFAKRGERGKRGNEIASQALSQQTNGIYSVSMQGAPYRHIKRGPLQGDVFHFVKVSYIPGKDLYQRARNAIKDDFRWVPANQIISGQVTALPHRTARGTSNDPIPNLLRVFLKRALPGVIKELNVAQQQAGPQAPPGTGWFGIPGAIYFYESSQPYYEFTNFAQGYPVLLDGKMWPTTEQYYQAQKFPHNPALQEEIRKLTSDAQGSAARKAFNLARAHKNEIRANWQSISLPTMLKAVRDKFTRHPALRDKLLNTGKAILVENAGANDDFFGAGATGDGQNQLGQILMRVRDELKGTANPQDPYVSHPASYYRNL
jgi:ribA/ribD-fused uncharacterized protein